MTAESALGKKFSAEHCPMPNWSAGNPTSDFVPWSGGLHQPAKNQLVQSRQIPPDRFDLFVHAPSF